MIELLYLGDAYALDDADLIRTKVNLVPESVDEVRVVETESKGGGNKRIRIVVLDG